MVTDSPPSAMALPTMEGSDPNRRCQMPLDNTATLPPRGLSSSGVKVRPTAGCAPKRRKNSCET